ncbi:hypothetical protein BEP19_04915 [Ammoniphilus oxalaticus]|uniref:YtpI-like protein n=1 Tax=Ammoniphilus oxalaticus TaxID=66863 RepID=A0A419SID4_9BACL|nr:YtpI family protein [Ammoniphilus oxalaticus]RKD23773.1 hypothetical protein BEP19_04915 [Ammoniphilus oxalaticus]
MILTGLTLTSLFLTVFFGIQYRMVKQPLARKIGQAIMNIFMGVTLILFAFDRFMLELTTIRMIMAIILLALGFVNLVMGIKNYRYFKNYSNNK